ncbi:unnamed protein product [Natator depressus]
MSLAAIWRRAPLSLFGVRHQHSLPADSNSRFHPLREPVSILRMESARYECIIVPGQWLMSPEACTAMDACACGEDAVVVSNGYSNARVRNGHGEGANGGCPCLQTAMEGWIITGGREFPRLSFRAERV